MTSPSSRGAERSRFTVPPVQLSHSTPQPNPADSKSLDGKQIQSRTAGTQGNGKGHYSFFDNSPPSGLIRDVAPRPAIGRRRNGFSSGQIAKNES
jgi:hypothetical protein